MRERTGGMLRQTPSGNNLLAGQMVVTFGTADPTNEQLTAPDGSLYLRNNAGTLELWGFSRDTGWAVL